MHQILLAADASTCCEEDYEGRTPLHLAIDGAPLEVLQAVLNSSPDDLIDRVHDIHLEGELALEDSVNGFETQHFVLDKAGNNEPVLMWFHSDAAYRGQRDKLRKRKILAYTPDGLVVLSGAGEVQVRRFGDEFEIHVIASDKTLRLKADGHEDVATRWCDELTRVYGTFRVTHPWLVWVEQQSDADVNENCMLHVRGVAGELEDEDNLIAALSGKPICFFFISSLVI